MTTVQCSSRVSACRRELNSHKAAKPREVARKRPQYALHDSGEGMPAGHRRHSTSPASSSQSCKAPPWHIERPHCVGSWVNQSVRWVAASNAIPSGLGRLRRQLECVAVQGRSRGARGACGGPPGVTRPWRVHRQRCFRAALPNPSLKPSPNGGPPGPSHGYGVHFPWLGPGVPPLGPA